MSKLSDEQKERARKNYSIIVQRLASVGNKSVALAIGCDESTISRMKPEKLQEFAEILSFMELKIVPENVKCFKKEDVDFLMYGSKKWHEHINSSDDLCDEF
ncbi:CII family transcriptional regulator [Entomomonas asaccharolytica]|uniref:Transcriptional regulator n=1 Tax=Entomomonas asaccharolytica TaxID=2785331 RepID=A0A974RY40_9GAMM|nr:CII family transcriptional regulator [Entomomonas asaccharolytica]QQP86916.1 transcriptional regulator [Entomomonas asaccharolytica]